MENMKLRCHPSIIFENIWQFWLVIVLIMIQQAESIVEVVKSIGTGGIMQVIRDGGIWALAGVLAVTAVIFIGGLQTACQQFFIDRFAAAQLGGNKGHD